MILKKRFSAFSTFLLFFFILQISNVFAQNEKFPWQFSFGIYAVDTFTTNTAKNGALFEDFFNVIDHWNFGSIPGYLGLTNHLGRGFSFGGRFSFNKITHYGNLPGDDNYYNLDVHLKYDLNKIFKGERFHPYMDIGGGYAIFDTTGAGYFNLGAGLEYLVGEKQRTALQLGSVFKNTGESYGVKHFQHYLGIGILFGNGDNDGDGILNKQDDCPEIPGLEEFNGCPDTDGDGIQDSEDKCPDIPGLLEFQGCPDTDGDGIPDNEDECPDVPGLAQFNGCPDTDGDGIQDSEDKCPDIPGLQAFQGCPDTDGDGVIDSEDECPDSPGLPENNGCPKLTQETEDRIVEIAQKVYFEFDKTTLKPESLTVLNELIGIFTKHSNLDILIVGHADNIGADEYNLDLSLRRAKAVMNYLVSKGIDPKRVSTEGYGESRPEASNETRDGRKLNRRVEFDLNK